MVNILCQWCDKPIVTIGGENENILIKIHVNPMICPECSVKYVVNELFVNQKIARKEVMWK